MVTSLNVFLVVLAALLGLLWLAALGLVIPPRRFKPHREASKRGAPRAFREGLPAPVQQHFEKTLGSPAPEIRSAVIWGGARARVRGVWVPLRFKTWMLPGRAFYRTLEVTWYRQPLLRGFEYFIDGQGHFEIGGEAEAGPNMDQSENLVLWALGVWAPSVFVHDLRIRWEAVDDHTARLVLPLSAALDPGTDELLAHFDPLTGVMVDLAGMRYRTLVPEDQRLEKEPWRVDLNEWSEFEGMKIPSQIALSWGASGSPWSYWWVEGAAFNVDVSDKLPRQNQPA